jgi:DNA-binding CsgD family transcriptional regulator
MSITSPLSDLELLLAADLSPREREICDLLAEGLSNRDVSDQLHISLRTVEMHRLRAMRKLGVRSTAQLVRRVLIASFEARGVEI